MKIGKRGLELIKRWEGYHKRLPDGRCQAYLDTLVRPALRSPGYNGLWTIGYGCTEGVYEGLVWTEKEAEKYLLIEVNKHVAHVNRILGQTKVTQNQFDALVSFSYNLGPGWLSKSDRPNGLIGLLKEGKTVEASNKFLGYVSAGGRRVQGLVNRRNDERNLFNSLQPNEVIEESRRMSWLVRLRNFFGFSGVAAFFSWENLGQAKVFMQDNAGYIILGAGVLGFLGYKLIEYMSMKEYEDGRYIPSGLSNVSFETPTDVPQEDLPAEVLKREETTDV